MNATPRSNVLHGTVVLTGFAALAALIVAGMWQLTAERIEANRMAARLAEFTEVLGEIDFDEINVDEPQSVSPPHTLPGEEAITYFPVYKDGQLRAWVFTVNAKGYNGPIELMIGIDTRARITGVRVIAHTETPGLGDDIEVRKSDWITRFNTLDYQGDADSRWALKRDGGDFDAFTGASITPRGVVNAVAQTLRWVSRHEEALEAGEVP
ncbi:MAG: RnfABCDGE type electron transport complex subunit G [Pseudomonadota bacterium]